MTKTQISTSVSTETRRKAEELVERAGYTYREIVSIGVDRIYAEWQRSNMDNETEERLLSIARQMHGDLCDCDDKRCTLTGEIYDWLVEGDLDDNPSVEQLVSEWREYAAPDA